MTPELVWEPLSNASLPPPNDQWIEPAVEAPWYKDRDAGRPPQPRPWNPDSIHILHPKIPNNIATDIISYFERDLHTVRALTLVHRAALPATHALLFKHLRMGYEHTLQPRSGVVSIDWFRIRSIFVDAGKIVTTHTVFPRPYVHAELVQTLTIVEGNEVDGTDWVAFRRYDEQDSDLEQESPELFSETLTRIHSTAKSLRGIALILAPPPFASPILWGPALWPMTDRCISTIGQKREPLIWSSLPQDVQRALLLFLSIPVIDATVIAWIFHFDYLEEWLRVLKSLRNSTGQVSVNMPIIRYSKPTLEDLPSSVLASIMQELQATGPGNIMSLLTTSLSLSRAAFTLLGQQVVIDSASACQQFLKAIQSPRVASTTTSITVYEGCVEDSTNWVLSSPHLPQIFDLIPTVLPFVDKLILRHHPLSHSQLSWRNFSIPFQNALLRVLGHRFELLAIQFPNRYPRQMQWLKLCQSLTHITHLDLWLPYIETKASGLGTRAHLDAHPRAQIVVARVFQTCDDAIRPAEVVGTTRLFSTVKKLVVVGLTLAAFDRVVDALVSWNDKVPLGLNFLHVEHLDWTFNFRGGPIVFRVLIFLPHFPPEGMSQSLSSGARNRTRGASRQFNHVRSIRLHFTCVKVHNLLAFLTAWSSLKGYGWLSNLKQLFLDLTFENAGERLDEEESLNLWRMLALRFSASARQGGVGIDHTPCWGKVGEGLSDVRIHVRAQSSPLGYDDTGLDPGKWMEALENMIRLGMVCELILFRPDGKCSQIAD